MSVLSAYDLSMSFIERKLLPALCQLNITVFVADCERRIEVQSDYVFGENIFRNVDVFDIRHAIGVLQAEEDARRFVTVYHRKIGKLMHVVIA